jgi:hypothetical protein
MSKYGNVIYGGTKYGDTPNLAYSVEPMSLNVLFFNETFVSWQEPKGNFIRFRIVRNQNGYPETAEDGVIVYEQITTNGSTIAGAIPISSIKDGLTNTSDPSFIPITPGRNIYYRVFLYTSANKWVKAGEIHGIVPKDTNVTDRMLNLLPRVLVSDVLSPFGVTPQRTDLATSDLYKFLDGIAFSYEELLTELDLIRPKYLIDPANFSTIPTETYSYGLELEPNLPVINQRRLIRDATYLYSTKGTKLGIENYSESLTGFIPTVTVSPNLLLNVQDSTFYKSTGAWAATNATLEAVSSMVPNTTTAKQIDSVYTCKIIASSSGSMVLGSTNPVTDGIPIAPSTQYTFSCKVKSPTSAGNITLSVQFFDKDKASTGSYTNSTVTPAVNSWSTISLTTTSASKSSYAVLKISYSAAGTYYVDEVCAQLGSSVNYDEARAITLHMDTTKTNYIENPSFEVNDNLWSKTGLTFATNSSSVPYEGYPGSNAGKFTATGTSWSLSCNSHIPVTPGRYLNVSMYSKSANITSMTMYIDLYDSSDVLLDTFEMTHMVESTWTRNHITALVGADSTASYAKTRFDGTSVSGNILYLDMVQAEIAYNPSDYFDGSMPTDIGALWEGTAHASVSSLYPRRAIKILRLAQTLTNWVPRNAWWRITTAAGLEYTNLNV